MELEHVFHNKCCIKKKKERITRKEGGLSPTVDRSVYHAKRTAMTAFPLAGAER